MVCATADMLLAEMQVPTKWSILGSLLILSSTFMMGLFEKKRDKVLEQQEQHETEPLADGPPSPSGSSRSQQDVVDAPVGKREG